MIVRATNKLLKISKIKPMSLDGNKDDLSGDWYANTLKTGSSGKLFILFFHNKTKISIICSTKSLNIATKQLSERVKALLVRHGFISLIDKFDLNSEISIYTTNSKSTLAFMNQVRSNIEWHLDKSDCKENADLEKIEDIHTDYLFSIDGKAGKYETTIDILKRFDN
jgi:hypothetical protein